MHMPFIRTTTNVNLDEAQEKSLREGTAELIKDILGKEPMRNFWPRKVSMKSYITVGHLLRISSQCAKIIE